MTKHNIFTTAFTKVYPLYVQKIERKNRIQVEVDKIVCWLTDYELAELQQQIVQEKKFEEFFCTSTGVQSQSGADQGCCLWGTSGRG